MMLSALHHLREPFNRPTRQKENPVAPPKLRLCLLALLWLAIVMLAFPVHSLAEHHIADDYIRTDFTVEDGLPDNVVNAIVQTENGLLWVGTQLGLASFDGREFTPVSLQIAGSPLQGAVHALLESANGDLWVGTQAGVILIPKATLDHFNPASSTFFHLGSGTSDAVFTLLQARDGVIWAGTNHGLYRQESSRFVEVIPDISISGLTQALNDHLLIIAKGRVIEWNGKAIIQHPGLAASLSVEDNQIFGVSQDSGGTMWYATAKGILRRGARPMQPLEPSTAATTSAFHIYQDPQGRLWVLSGTGVYLVSGNRMDTPVPVYARAFYVGRDGGLWVGSNGEGLVHLKRRVVQMFTMADGLPNDIAMTVLSTHDGKLWVGSNCGLSVREGDRFKVYKEKDGLLNACVWSLAEDQSGALWIGTYGGGLFQWSGGHFQQYSIAEGLISDVVLEVMVARDGSLWLATPDGVSHMQNGRFRNYTSADGLSSDQILSVYQDHSGAIWAVTQNGIDRLTGSQFVALSSSHSRDGPSSIRLAEDSAGDLFALDFPRGISLVDNGQLTPLNDDLKVFEMKESPGHDLWFSGNNGIIRVRLDDLRRSAGDHSAPLDYGLIDRADGLNSIQCSVGSPNLTITPDNKLWIATVKGLAMLDLAHLPGASSKPKVFVGTVTIGKETRPAGNELLLAQGTHHLELHLEAVDLASPEKVRLQYRMDGVDAAWLDADASRTAVYTSIPVGPHLFHVRASGSDGVWDRAGIVYNVTQQPYFYQTTWFYVVSISVFLLLLSGAYLVRVQQIVRQTRMRLEERLVERERIARELHDTLLQGVLSASMQLDLAEDQLPDDSPTKPLLNRILQMMRQVIQEGRDALRGLRTHEADSSDLAVAFSRMGREFAVDEKIGYRVIVQGAARPLRPQIRDEVYRIGREAIVNAFVHASANSVEVEIEYAGRYFRILVRDDGCGIAPQVLETGREGHWGLVGMRERSQSVGAAFKLRSRLDAGTEVELTVPAVIAFENGSSGPISRWLLLLSRENSKNK